MIGATLRRKATAWTVLLGCGLALVRCGHEKVAGSSVTTGNPTEIQVGFTGENGPVAVAGRVEIYGATQIPVPGFRPEPLKAYPVDGDRFLLNAGHFDGIADSLWAAGSLEGDSLARFNLVVIGASQGAVLRGLALNLKDGSFTLPQDASKAGTGSAVSMTAGLTPLIEYQAFIDPSSLETTRHNYLFLQGTGYTAKSDSGSFTFPAVPAGSHRVLFLSLPDKQINTMDEDTADVYGLDKGLTAGKADTLHPSALEFQLPMPAEYRP